MPLEKNATSIKRLIKLVKEFGESCGLTPSEFIEKQTIFAKKSIGECMTECFIQLMKHVKVLESIAFDFWKCYSLKPCNKSVVTVLIYLIMFRFENENFSSMLDFLKDFNYLHSQKLIEYFTNEDNLVAVARAASKIFDNDYVIQNILHPLLSKIEIIRNLQDKLVSALLMKNSIRKKPTTIPKGPPLLQKVSKKPPPPPIDTPIQHFPKFKSISIPEFVYTGDTNLQQKLEKEYTKNQIKAIELLKQAQQDAFKCARASTPKNLSETDKKRPSFKATKMPPLKTVTIRSNAAALMREAAALEKEQEKECKKIEQVLNGGFDCSKIEALEEEIRRSIEQQNLQEIERKHLLGQLTHEEAIIAKNELMKANKDNYEKCQVEKAALMQQLEDWREEQYIKLKEIVDKTQAIQKAVKEAEKKVQVTKQRNAKMLQNETKKLLEEAYEEKEKELDRKIQLIAEIRTLHQVTMSLQIKEFDPTECPNFGLLCEMSIAELQERLGLMKIEMKRELEERKAAIAKDKEKQKTFMEDIKNYISQVRTSKTKPQPKVPLKLQETPDLTALRERLNQAKNLRMAAV